MRAARTALLILALAVVLVAEAAPVAAQGGGERSPSQLWDEFPLRDPQGSERLSGQQPGDTDGGGVPALALVVVLAGAAVAWAAHASAMRRRRLSELRADAERQRLQVAWMGAVARAHNRVRSARSGTTRSHP